MRTEVYSAGLLQSTIGLFSWCFSNSSGEIDDVAADSNTLNEDLSNAMAAYSAAISKTKDIKLSK